MLNSEQAGKSSLASRRWTSILGLIVASFLTLGVVYAVVTPPLESSDEYKHYPVVHYIQTTGDLVVLDPDEPGRWLQEGAQPPLYYAIMAALTSAIDTSDLDDVHQRNPHVYVGDPNQIHNKNLIIHDSARELWPDSGTILAVRVIRLASLLLGAGTIVLTALLGRLIFSSRAGLLAAALTAFNPMFLFVHAAVNNDSLAIFLGSLGIWLTVRLWRALENAETSRITRRTVVQIIVLGAVLGLGLLTKLSVGGLLGVAGLALLLQAWRKRAWRVALVGGVLLALPALLVSGWWFGRNAVLYGDLTGLSAFITVQGTRAAPIQLSDWVAEFGTFYRTYWGLFGGVNIAAPQWVYWLSNALFLVGIAGLVRYRKRWRDAVRSGAWLLLVWIAVLVVLLLRWNIISPAFQGRLIFPALGSINVLWAAGWLAWDRLIKAQTGRNLWIPLWITALFALIAVGLPWITIRPAYAYPEPIATVPASAEYGPVTFTAPDGVLQLVGAEVTPEQQTEPGADTLLTVTLYWRADAPVSADYVSTVHLLGRDFQSVGNVSRYPGWGMIPTSRWQPGQIWRDEYGVRVNADADAPSQLRLDVGLYDAERDVDLPATGPDGVPLEFVLVGDARLVSAELPPAPALSLDARFDDGITLAGATLPERVTVGTTVPITLTWSASRTPSDAYTVFVQLLDESGTLVASGDSPPAGGFYPTTLWQAGDTFADAHALPLPADLDPGAYTVAVGLYNPATLARLSLQGGGDAVTWPLTVGAP